MSANQIYAIRPTQAINNVSLDAVWTQGATGGVPDGYTSITTLQVGGNQMLFAYNKTTDKSDVYALTSGDPWVQQSNAQVDLSGGPWDALHSFIFGNDTYLLTYRTDNGTFGFFRIAQDLSVSPPYLFVLPRNTPTKGFTTVAPFNSLGAQYVLGYNFDDGTVAVFSVAVIASSNGGIPPLIGLNVWYHRWAHGWTRFAFFQLGGANFFFKINTAKLNVNIDHLQDNPAMGTVEVGSALQAQLPDALSIDIAAHVPWGNGDPYFLTYIASSGSTAVYRIHGDCLGWTQATSTLTTTGSTTIVPYRIGNTSYALFYGGK